MKHIKRILVAVDFSLYSSQVLRFAADLARELTAELTVVNVLNQRDVLAIEMIGTTYAAPTTEQFIKAATAERSGLLDKLLLEEGAGSLNAKKVIRVGIPFKEILKAVEEERADLLVMGTKGRSNIADALFGSTAEKVFRRCPVALVSVRPPLHVPGESAG